MTRNSRYYQIGHCEILVHIVNIRIEIVDLLMFEHLVIINTKTKTKQFGMPQINKPKTIHFLLNNKKYQTKTSAEIKLKSNHNLRTSE